MKKSKAVFILLSAVIIFGGAAISFIGLTHKPNTQTQEIPLNASTFFPSN